MANSFNAHIRHINMENFQVIQANPQIKDIIVDFFKSVDNSLFHPHPFDEENAERIINEKEDLYYFIISNNEVVSYGMLRGWKEGYETPSLGIYVNEKYRGQGIARFMMEFLHLAAKFKGAKKVRLTVYASNTKAINLYHSLGYSFEHMVDDQLLGIKKI